jgi:hypothetical protein
MPQPTSTLARARELHRLWRLTEYVPHSWMGSDRALRAMRMEDAKKALQDRAEGRPWMLDDYGAKPPPESHDEDVVLAKWLDPDYRGELARRDEHLARLASSRVYLKYPPENLFVPEPTRFVPPTAT